MKMLSAISNLDNNWMMSIQRKQWCFVESIAYSIYILVMFFR